MRTQTPPAHSTDAIARDLARLVRGAVGQALLDTAQPGDLAAPLNVPPALQPSGPQRLAATQPAASRQRREALALYERCLRHYRAAIQPRLSPVRGSDDLGAAAAFFVQANLAAGHDAAPDETLHAALAAQLARLIQRTDAWQHAPLAERQNLFEQLALLGVLVNESRLQAREQGPAAQAQLQRAARGYLLQLLGLDPELLVLTPQGLAAASVHRPWTAGP
jgi:hypothetical protein